MIPPTLEEAARKALESLRKWDGDENWGDHEEKVCERLESALSSHAKREEAYRALERIVASAVVHIRMGWDHIDAPILSIAEKMDEALRAVRALGEDPSASERADSPEPERKEK